MNTNNHFSDFFFSYSYNMDFTLPVAYALNPFKQRDK